MKQIIAYDFDATLATYIKPWNLNLLGKPIQEVIKSLRYHYNKGDYILIFTGRKNNKMLREWLKINKVPYNGININPKPNHDASPFKPYFTCVIDDKAVNPWDLKTGKIKTTKQILWEINKIITRGKKRNEKIRFNHRQY